MSGHIGLYYPFIHFRDESWLKLTSLYWDRMGRIVPEGYGLRDNDTGVFGLGRAGYIACLRCVIDGKSARRCCGAGRPGLP